MMGGWCTEFDGYMA